MMMCWEKVVVLRLVEPPNLWGGLGGKFQIRNLELSLYDIWMSVR